MKSTTAYSKKNILLKRHGGGKKKCRPWDLISFPSSFTPPLFYSKQSIIKPQEELSLSARAVVVHVPLYSINTHTPWFPVQMTPSNGEQYLKALQSSSVSQVWQFTQSFVTPLTLPCSKESFFFSFLIRPTPSFRGMRENLSALLWHSACCLRAVRPAASPDLHCVDDMLLLCQDKIYK